MGKLYTTYVAFRIVIPGQFAAVIFYIYGRLHFPQAFQSSVTGFSSIGAIAAIGVFLGLMMHYVLNYPRRRMLFRNIEKAHGPIDYLLKKCRECTKLCSREKTYDSIASRYFSLLNEDINPQTSERVYYFSSIYLMLTHISFVSGVGAFLLGSSAGVNLRLKGTIQPESLMLSCVLAILGFALSSPNSEAVKCLKTMFDIQRQWVIHNEVLVRKKVCPPQVVA